MLKLIPMDYHTSDHRWAIDLFHKDYPDAKFCFFGPDREASGLLAGKSGPIREIEYDELVEYLKTKPECTVTFKGLPVIEVLSLDNRFWMGEDSHSKGNPVNQV